MHDLAEMARIAASYTARLSPDELRLSRIGRFIWLRLNVRAELRPRTRSVTTNLVFRLAADSTHSLPSTRRYYEFPTHPSQPT
jgi:hypothetical protein